MVGNACAQVNSVSVPRVSVQWTCGIAVQGDYACGGGAPVHRWPSPVHILASSILVLLVSLLTHDHCEHSFDRSKGSSIIPAPERA